MTTNSIYGICTWFPEHGDHLIVDADREDFAALSPTGKIFNYLGKEGEWLRLQYGERIYRVSPSVFKSVPSPAFQIGEKVQAAGKLGVIVDLGWHFKNEAPIYFLAFEGRRSSRRYSPEEILSVKSTG